MPSADASTDVALRLSRAREILRGPFGHAAFRAGQEDAVRSALAGRSLLVVMPTGSGKSLLYQLPALVEGGLTLVVSPLIALMKDQVDELVRRGVAATFINSSLGPEEQRERIRRCLADEVRLLYVAPERFQSAAFLAMLAEVTVVRMAVDEAHCISEWGHDFRPDYRRLKTFRRRLGDPPVTALTATATPRVQKDIVESLGLDPSEVDVHVHGFDRPNLELSCVHAATRAVKDDLVRDLVASETGAGIVYVGTRRAAEELADAIADLEPRHVVYHAGLEPEERVRAQEAFLAGDARVALATVAFGMGIDKPDIRFVCHYHYPGSVEQYYQEIGRAGRDGEPSRCVLLFAPKDRHLREFFIDLSYPTREQVRSVFQTLWSTDANPVLMTYAQIADMTGDGLKDGQVASALRLLDGAGLTRAMGGDAAAYVTLLRPGAEVLPGVRGQVQRRVFTALGDRIDLERSGRYPLDLQGVAHAADLSMEQVRRALAALDEGGHLDYEPPFRGRGVEKLMEEPPPFDEAPIDWERQGFLRGLELEKLEAIEDYIRGRRCRRAHILRYFGDQTDLVCGTCDVCAAGTRGAAGRGDVAGRRPDAVRLALECVAALRFPLGVTMVAKVLTGSREKNVYKWDLHRNPAYAALHARQDEAKGLLRRMLEDGYLAQEGERGRPVLALSPLGEETLEQADQATPAPGSLPPMETRRPTASRSPGRVSESGAAQAETPPPPPPVPAEGPAAAIAGLIDGMLGADREGAQERVDALRHYHPALIAQRLGAHFDSNGDPRALARIAWAAGELCGEHGLALLARAADSEIVHVRRLAASALGKVARSVRIASTARQQALVLAKESLERLTTDHAPQVRQYAEKALGEFDGN